MKKEMKLVVIELKNKYVYVCTTKDLMRTLNEVYQDSYLGETFKSNPVENIEMLEVFSSFGIMEKEDKLEEYYIKGYTILNREFEPKKVNTGRRGKFNPNSRPISHYEDKPVLRATFKRTCERRCWNFNDFEEIFHSYKPIKSGSKQKLYIYKLKENVKLKEEK